MKRAKKLVLFVLCLSIIMSASIPALASDNDVLSDNDAPQPKYDITYYINGDGVNLRSGPGTEYSSGGLLFYGTMVTRFPARDEYDSFGNRWAYVRVETGPCRLMKGYVLSIYVSSKHVPGEI